MRKAKTKPAPWRCPECGAAMEKSSAMSISDCGECIEAEDMTGLWKAYADAVALEKGAQ